MTIPVIIADDHPLTRSALISLLEQERDIELVGELADGESALAAIRDLRPRVALLDIRMPGMDGISVIRETVADAAQTACVVLTCYDSPQYALSAMRAGARGYVLKTSSPSVIVQAIRAAAVGETFIDDEVAKIAGDMLDGIAPEPISSREREVLLLAARGNSGKEIAGRLFISERTVQTHLASIYDKLGARNRTESMLLALKNGVVTLEELLD